MSDYLEECLRDAVLSSRMHLIGDTVWVPDDGPCCAEDTTDWGFSIYGMRYVYWDGVQRFSEMLDKESMLRFVVLFENAVNEGTHHHGTDTAVGRYVSGITAVLQLGDRPENRTERISFNHYASFQTSRQTGWGDLLAAVEQRVYPLLGEHGRRKLSFLANRFIPRLPADEFEAGEILRCSPGGLTRVDLRGGFFLRLGQPPAHSRLFLVEPVSQVGSPPGLKISESHEGSWVKQRVSEFNQKAVSRWAPDVLFPEQGGPAPYSGFHLERRGNCQVEIYVPHNFVEDIYVQRRPTQG